MSVSSVKLEQWRAEGSLRYLAWHLGVTPRQAARYWDQGCIPGAYRRKRAGHRRIRYTDMTVAQVAQRVAVVRERNREARYGRRPRGDVLWEAKLLRDSVLAAQGISLEAVAEDEMVLSLIQLEDLLATQSPQEFRRAAMANYRFICAELAAADLRAHPDQGPWSPTDGWLEIRPWQKRVDRLIRPLLSQPDLRKFARAYETALQELTWRDDENPTGYRRAIAHFHAAPGKAILATALVALREKNPGKNPTASALAAALSMSRPALYRAFDAKTIQTALNTIRNDAVAIGTGRKMRKKATEAFS